MVIMIKRFEEKRLKDWLNASQCKPLNIILSKNLEV